VHMYSRCLFANYISVCIHFRNVFLCTISAELQEKCLNCEKICLLHIASPVIYYVKWNIMSIVKFEVNFGG
jgi:hypothetical protein